MFSSKMTTFQYIEMVPPSPLPIDSPCGPLVAQMLCSRGWNSLKQKPSFLEGLSISSHVLRRTVPHQWEDWGEGREFILV